MQEAAERWIRDNQVEGTVMESSVAEVHASSVPLGTGSPVCTLTLLEVIPVATAGALAFSRSVLSNSHGSFIQSIVSSNESVHDLQFPRPSVGKTQFSTIFALGW